MNILYLTNNTYILHLKRNERIIEYDDQMSFEFFSSAMFLYMFQVVGFYLILAQPPS